MTFGSHKVVKEYVSELKNITEARDTLRARLTEVWDQVYKADSDYERSVLTKSAKDLEQQVSALTNKGGLYMRKIDEFNGVR